MRLTQQHIEARRAFRALCSVHQHEIDAEFEMQHADYLIDYGEWSSGREPEPRFYSACGVVQERLLLAVAARYEVEPEALDDALRTLDEYEDEARDPTCPYHERGLDCRNSAPRGIDADGEPFGDQGCGCNVPERRARIVQRLRRVLDPYIDATTRPVFERVDHRIVCHNTPQWSAPC